MFFKRRIYGEGWAWNNLALLLFTQRCQSDHLVQQSVHAAPGPYRIWFVGKRKSRPLACQYTSVGSLAFGCYETRAYRHKLTSCSNYRWRREPKKKTPTLDKVLITLNIELFPRFKFTSCIYNIPRLIIIFIKFNIFWTNLFSAPARLRFFPSLFLN